MKLHEVIDAIQMWTGTVQEMYHSEINVMLGSKP